MSFKAALTWDRLPEALRERHQWLLAVADAHGNHKVPKTVNAAGTLLEGSSTNPDTWLTFERACAVARERGCGIGYVLRFDDPFACIDLDVKNQYNAPGKPELWSTPEQIQLCTRVLYSFDSYTERSASGQGLHIWVRGKIGKGVKRDGIELYSQERFIVCTGDVWMDKPIQDRQQMLTHMASQMREAAERSTELVEVAEEDSDADVYERAAHAANADKFLALCAGKWEDEYPSQSEADLALMSMFTFYSKSNEQCRRLFRMTALGKRDKAQKNDRYLNFTLALIRARQDRENRIIAKVDLTAQEMRMKLAMQEIDKLEGVGEPNAGAVAADSAPAAALVPTSTPAPPVAPAAPLAAPPGEALPGVAWPPGFAGALAGFIYRNAPRPVKEVAIVAALGWLAGVCGKAWMIPGSGLNLYIILVARSAVGKEAMHTGLSVLTQTLIEKGYVTANKFVDFSDFASGPALRKAVNSNPSFLNVSGEWGRKLKRLSADGPHDGPMTTLRTEMTNLYQKSGPQSIVGGMFYSNKENNVASTDGVNYSMIGETTPGTFYDALTESMMEDGFLSRFTIVEYAGLRPASNPAPQRFPEPELVKWCGQLTTQASLLLNNKTPVMVQRTQEAAVLMDELDRYCDEQINKTLDESWRQMWNRAHLKTLRIAALLAVGDNPSVPEITVEHMRWATDLVQRDIKIMQRKLESGEVGTGDGTRERKLLAICKDYLSGPLGAGYAVPDAMHAAGVVPRKYFQIRTSRLTLFTQAKQGAIRALTETIQSLCDSGYLLEVDKMKAADDYGFQGRCYRIANLPDGLLE